MGGLIGIEEFRSRNDRAQRLAKARPALRWALRKNVAGVEKALQAEERALRAADQRYWRPLREELFHWRTEGRRDRK